MSDDIRYALRLDGSVETPCHICELNNGDLFYLVTNTNKSELRRAIGEPFITEINTNAVWSIPYENVA